MNTTDKLELQVAEDVDGSATVILDEGLKEGGSVDDDHDDDARHAMDDEVEAQVSGRTEEEREEIRAARREERKLKKQIHKGKVRESNHLIDSLRRQNTDLAERLSHLEKKSVGADMARLDKSIEDDGLRMQYAKSKIAEATSVMDGKALAEAQEMWYDARRQAESLDAVKKRAVTEPQRQSSPNDAKMQRKAAVWMERNSWYDPDGKDTDSAIAVKIDESLAAEGWDPTTDEYWSELDERLTKYMPHRYNRGTENRSSGRSPRSVVTGSGREASSASSRPGEYKISPDRVKAMKDAGKWEDPIERQKMIRKYVEYDRGQGR